MTKLRLRSVAICEDIARSAAPAKVDRNKGIIYNAKILGEVSENNRLYPSSTRQQALHFYRNLPINVDHPDKPNKMRSSYDRLGKTLNVKDTPSGMFGDVKIIKSHPMAKRVFEAAESMPDVFGFSHNAEGDGYFDSGGRFVVEKITEVRSVDLVSEPATTKSLYESRTHGKTKMKTLRKIIQESKLSRTVKKSLLEDFDEDQLNQPIDLADDSAEVEMDDLETEGDGGDWKKHLVDAIDGLVQADDVSSHDKAMEILKMLAPEAPEESELDGNILDDGEGEGEMPLEEEDDDFDLGDDDDDFDFDDDETDDDDVDLEDDDFDDSDDDDIDIDIDVDDDEEDDDEEMKEGKNQKTSRYRKLQEQVKRLEFKDWARAAAEKLGVSCDKNLIEAVVLIGDKKKAVAHLKYIKSLQENKDTNYFGVYRGNETPNGKTPRSAGRRLSEATGAVDKEITESGGIAAFLLN